MYRIQVKHSLRLFLEKQQKDEQESKTSSSSQIVHPLSNQPQNLFQGSSAAFQGPLANPMNSPNMTSSPIPEGAHGSSAPSINRGPFGGQRYNATEADMRVMESLEALSLSSRGTGEEIIYQRQEQKRLSLESKMANVLRLNSQSRPGAGGHGV